MDEYMASAIKADPGLTAPNEWINASQDFKTAMETVQAEHDLRKKCTPGVSTGVTADAAAAEEASTAEQKERDAKRSADPAVAQLWNKAASRRAEVCNLAVCPNVQSSLLNMVCDSVAGQLEGSCGTKHVAIVGDMAVLPDVPNRPWCRPPMYTSATAHNRMQAAQNFFIQDDKEHTVLVFFDSAREGNRAPIRKAFEDVEKSLGSAHGGKQSTSREFFLHTAPRPGSKHNGTGTALDVEMMFVKTRQPLSQIKKKARIHHEGNTTSTLYGNVTRQQWKQLLHVGAVTKQAIFGDAVKVTTSSLDPTNWSTPALKTPKS